MSSDGSQYGGGSPSGSSAKASTKVLEAPASSASSASMSASNSASNSASMSMEEFDPMIGQVLDGRYKLVKKLGEGGMGEVYAAEHVHISKRVAVKLLRNEIVQNDEAVTRFRQEARSASSIGHKNIAGIEDFGKLDDGRLYLCMELLDGAPFNEMIETPMDPARLLNILIQTGHGLAAAHAKGIVHRDMKPENIFVTQADGQDVPKLLDFGIAKVAQSEGENHLTKTGTIFGTPFYMAPEQALGSGVDVRADVYAMGVIMYECFCGDVPFQGESFMAILTQHITSEPLPPSDAAAKNRRTLPPGIEEIIIRAMKKEPAERYQTMDEMVQVLVNAYRNIAGAGMSGYMQAHVPPPSAMFSTPQFGAASGNSVHPAATPGPMSPPVAAAAHAAQSSGGFGVSADSSLSFDAPRKKGKAGIIIAILAVLAVVGGGAAFLLMSGGSKSGGEANAASTGTRSAAEKGSATAAKSDTRENNGSVRAANNGTTETNGSGSTENSAENTAPVASGAVIDAGIQRDPDWGAPVEPGTEPKAPVEEAMARPIPVSVTSVPAGAVAYQAGQRIDTTPFIVKILPGEPLALVIKKRGYRDKKVSLDGKSARVSVSLKRRRSGHDHGPRSGKKPPRTTKPDPDDKPTFDPNKLEDGVLGGDE